MTLGASLRGALGYLIYLGFATAVLILTAEGLGRGYMYYRYGVPGKTYGLWIGDPELGASHRPNGYNSHTSLNGLGCRNREDLYEPRPTNGLRVLAFGGSTTYGYNLADGDTYPERLEARLRSRPGWDRSQVLNAGRITYSAAQNLTLMRRLVPRVKPDYALLYEGINELYNAWMLARDGVSLDSLGERCGVIGRSYDYNRWLLRNSILVRYLDYVVKARLTGGGESHVAAPGGTQAATAPDVHPWLLRNYEHLLREQIVYLRGQGVTPVVYRYASVGSEGQRVFSELSARIARETGTPVCDMEARFDSFGPRKRQLFIGSGVHVTPEGARILAEEVEAVLVGLEAARNADQAPAAPTARAGPTSL